MKIKGSNPFLRNSYFKGNSPKRTRRLSRIYDRKKAWSRKQKMQLRMLMRCDLQKHRRSCSSHLKKLQWTKCLSKKKLQFSNGSQPNRKSTKENISDCEINWKTISKIMSNCIAKVSSWPSRNSTRSSSQRIASSASSCLLPNSSKTSSAKT